MFDHSRPLAPQQYRQLAELAAEIAGVHNLDDLRSYLSERLGDLIHFDRCTIAIEAPGERGYIIYPIFDRAGDPAIERAPTLQVHGGEWIISRVFQNGKMFYSSPEESGEWPSIECDTEELDFDDEDDDDSELEAKAASVIACPLKIHGDETHGVLYLESSAPRLFRSVDAVLMRNVAKLIEGTLDRIAMLSGLDQLLDERTQELRESLDKYIDFYDLSPHMMCSLLPGTLTILECNQTFVEALGERDKRDCVGRSLAELCDPECHEALELMLDNLRLGGRVIGCELLLRHQSGKSLPVIVNAGAIRKENRKIAQYDCVLNDISELRRLKKLNAQLLQSEQKAERFAQTVAHDLRAPLRRIGGFIDVLLGEINTEKLSGAAQESVKYIKSGVLSMQRVISALYRHQKKTRKISDLRSLKISVLAQRALDDLAPLIKETGAKVEIEGNVTELTDPTLVQLLLQNLVENGLKYRSLERPCEIRIRSFRDGDEWSVSVQDNGVGIAKDDCEKIFGIFRRVDGNNDIEGSGIGLAVCQSIVLRLGGRLSVQSELEEGTKFVATFPAQSCIDSSESSAEGSGLGLPSNTEDAA